jgi:hypothetical protein
VRSFKEVVVDMVKQPPMLLFHILWLVYSVWTLGYGPVSGANWLEIGWQVGFTIFWLATCDLRKWGAIGYIALAAANAIIYFLKNRPKLPDPHISNLFEISIIFSLALFYYYKKFR